MLAALRARAPAAPWLARPRARRFSAAPNAKDKHAPFKLAAKPADLKPPKFGYNGLGELVYVRTYARKKTNGALERWRDTVERVVNGTFNLQRRHSLHKPVWKDEAQEQAEATEMFKRIHDMKFLPPGRGLWAMGTVLTEQLNVFAALNNCAFVSTQNLAVEFDPVSSLKRDSKNRLPIDPFTFLMDAAMLGVGVGFDTLGADKLLVVPPRGEAESKHIVADSREGWVESIALLLRAWLRPADSSNVGPFPKPHFDFTKIRKAGLPIKGFGGVSAGKEPLVQLHHAIDEQLSRLANKPLSSRGIVDIMNLIGRCVVSGNVRRTAEIAFGSPTDEEYIRLKDYDVNPDREAFGWTSNNSVFAVEGMDYSPLVGLIAKNGEPGFMWLENARKFGRMHPDDTAMHFRDARAMGGNPCLEQTLESYELCCLVETFPQAHETLEDYLATLRCAFLYAKTVTLASTHWSQSNEVMARNRRIGCSMSGIAQFITARGEAELVLWCDEAYREITRLDKEFSERFGVPESIKRTCVKPSGTVSLLAGATPGIHYPESRWYIRRVRLASNSPLIIELERAGYEVEPSVTEPDKTVVVSVPIDAGDGIQSVHERSMRDQVALAALMQRHWADNQVSCTVTFDPQTETQLLAPTLSEYESKLKGISFLPRLESGSYAQMPYEAISKEKFEAMHSKLKPLDLEAFCESTRDEPVVIPQPLPANVKHKGVDLEPTPDSFCDSDVCQRL